MTTIAYRAGILASDTAQTFNSMRIGTMQKIARRSDGTLVGAAGDASYVTTLMKWAKSSAKGNPPLPVNDGGTGLIVSPRGKITLVDDGGLSTCKAEYIAIGSGGEMALGAMGYGASAEEAVAVALKHDCHSGGEVVALKRN
jgi:20S proteasome alpha/beta subunit